MLYNTLHRHEHNFRAKVIAFYKFEKKYLISILAKFKDNLVNQIKMKSNSY